MRSPSARESVSHAITDKNLDGLKEELDKNGVENIFVRASNGWTALMVACYLGDDDFVRALLDWVFGRENSEIEEEVLPYIDTVAVVTEYYDAGSDTWHYIHAGYSALHIAIRMGHPKIAIMLLENGADIRSHKVGPGFDVDEDFYDYENPEEDGAYEDAIAEMPQHVAAEKGLVEVLAKLVSLGAEIDRKDEEGYTALFLASLNGHPNAVKFLLENGANPDIVNLEGGLSGIYIDYSAIHAAAKQGELECVEILIEHGASLTLQSESGTPFLVAVEHLNLDVIRLIVEKDGYKVDDRAKNGSSPFQLAVKASGEHSDIFEVMSYLVDVLKVDVNIKNDDGYNALHTVVSNLCLRNEDQITLDITEHLINKGIAVDALDKDGNSALIHAARSLSFKTICLLLQHGACIDRKSNKGEFVVEIIFNAILNAHYLSHYNHSNPHFEDGLRAVLKLGAYPTCSRMYDKDKWNDKIKYLAEDKKSRFKKVLDDLLEIVNTESNAHKLAQQNAGRVFGSIAPGNYLTNHSQDTGGVTRTYLTPHKFSEDIGREIASYLTPSDIRSLRSTCSAQYYEKDKFIELQIDRQLATAVARLFQTPNKTEGQPSNIKRLRNDSEEKVDGQAQLEKQRFTSDDKQEEEQEEDHTSSWVYEYPGSNK